MSDDNKLNLPAIRKGGGLSTQGDKKKIQELDLNKKSKVGSIIKEETSSVQKEVINQERGLDLVLAGDLTGSMAAYHRLLKDKFVELCNELFPMIENLRIGIIFYLDHGSGDPYVTRVQKLTNNVQELLGFINGTATGHGGDADEAVEDALNDLTKNMNWKEVNPKSVVIFGDASPHPANNCPSRHDFFDLTETLYSKNITINSVYCGTFSSDKIQQLKDTDIGDFNTRIGYLNPAEFFSWIANVTGGMVISIDRIDDLVDIIKASAAKDSGHLADFEKKMKETSPNKLNLVEIAKRADKRKITQGNNRKLLK